MGIFSKPKENNSKIYEELGLINAKIAGITAEIDKLDQLIKQLRGVVNKKLNYEPEAKTENNIKGKNINNYGRNNPFGL